MLPIASSIGFIFQNFNLVPVLSAYENIGYPLLLLGTGASIIELMRKVQHERAATFIFSTHDAQLVSHAEETYTIRDGKLVEHRSEAA